MTLKAGFSKIPITPPAGSKLTGYSARQGVSTGTHDPIFARALVLDNADTALALVSVEVLALAADFVASVRNRIARSTGISPDAILIAATHTHSGPLTISTFFNADEQPDEAYMERLAAAIEESVNRAWCGRFPARVGTGSCAVEGIGVNRRHPADGPVDREAGILRVDDAAGRTRAVAVVYGCHPTVLGFNNLLVSGDYPSVALAHVEAALGPDCMALFFNGTSGNVSIGHSSELSAIGVITPDRTFERAAEVGTRLGTAVCSALGSIHMDSEVQLGATRGALELAGRQYPPAKELEAALAEAEQRSADNPSDRKAQVSSLYAAIDCANARQLAAAGGRVPLEMQALAVNSSVFLGVGAELFAETGMAIKRNAPKRTFVIGLANGYVGYIPTARAFNEPGYEGDVASCAPDSEERIIRAAVEFAGSMP